MYARINRKYRCKFPFYSDSHEESPYTSLLANSSQAVSDPPSPLSTQVFHNITGPILYKRAVVDMPHLFSFGHDQPVADPKIESKRQLLARVRHLQLELPPLSEEHRDEDPSSHKASFLTATSRITGFFELIAGSGPTSTKLALRLGKLPLGAIHGETSIWKKNSIDPGRSYRAPRARVGWIQLHIPLVIVATGATHFCMRGDCGLFALPKSAWWCGSQPLPAYDASLRAMAQLSPCVAIHGNYSDDLVTLAVVPGITTRIIYDNSDALHLDSANRIGLGLLGWMIYMPLEDRALARQYHSATILSIDDSCLELVVDQAEREEELARMRRQAEAVQREAQLAFDPHKEVMDVRDATLRVQIRLASELDACQACRC